MKTSRLALFGIALGFALLQACSSDDTSEDDGRPQTAEARFKTREPVTFVEHAVNANHHFSDTVDATQPNKRIVPTSGNSDVLSKLEVGSILAGDRNAKDDLQKSKNPFGFLRKVVSITKDGDNTVIETAPASLDEWVKNGDIYYSDKTSLFSTDEGGLGTKALHLNADQGGGSGSGSGALTGDFEGEEVGPANYKIRPKISFSNGSLQLNTNYDGYFRIRSTWGSPTGVKTDVEVDDPFT